MQLTRRSRSVARGRTARDQRAGAGVVAGAGRGWLNANTSRSPSGVATLLNCAGPPTPGGSANSTRGVPDSIPLAVLVTSAAMTIGFGGCDMNISSRPLRLQNNPPIAFSIETWRGVDFSDAASAAGDEGSSRTT